MKNIYQNRREQVLQRIGKAVMIIPANTTKVKSRDTFFPFRQDNDFYYLSGFNEEQAVLVLDGKNKQSILINKAYDELHAIWEGELIGQERAISEYLFDKSYPLEKLEETLLPLMFSHDKIIMPYSRYPLFDTMILKLINQAKQTRRARSPQHIEHSDLILHEMRLIKDAHEINLMQIAADISSEAHIEAMRQTKPNMNEFEIASLFDYEFAKKNATWAYSHIVAGGKNACVLHYRENNKPLNDNELILIDAGAEYGNYAGDITRTFPINGVFSETQKKIYNWVLKSQLAAIEACKIGNNIRSPHDAARSILVDAMIDLQLLSESKQTIIEQNLDQKYFMHGTSHWLGLDVHDVGEYFAEDNDNKPDNTENWLPLRAGMVLTVEPGIYIRADDMSAPAELRGIGIRIEDDVLVTDKNPLVLTAKCPKTVEEIEKICNS